MKRFLKKTSSCVTLLSASTLLLAPVLLEERVPAALSLALYTGSGVLLGVGTVGLVLSVFNRRMTPEERKELERGETDERNVAIREKAAMSSWYWTLYLLWAAFMGIQIFIGGLWGVAVSALIVLHCTFYMINIHRWSKKM